MDERGDLEIVTSEAVPSRSLLGQDGLTYKLQFKGQLRDGSKRSVGSLRYKRSLTFGFVGWSELFHKMNHKVKIEIYFGVLGRNGVRRGGGGKRVSKHEQ